MFISLIVSFVVSAFSNSLNQNIQSSTNSIPPFAIHDVKVGPQLPSRNSSEVNKEWGKYGTLLAHSNVSESLPAVEFMTAPSLLAWSVYNAFYKHYPLKINPNAIWLTICQGFATYVDANAEALRSKFVSFDGKKTLEVTRRVSSRNLQQLDWEGDIFPDFIGQITGFVGEKTGKLLDSNFSNTTPVDRTAAYITVMDIMKHYFRYHMTLIGCGIPYVELLGTVEDWKQIRAKAEALREYVTKDDDTLTWWLGELLPVLDHFVAAATGNPDLSFWGAVCNVFSTKGSGMRQKGATITGWMQVFFPYKRETDPNVDMGWMFGINGKKKGNNIKPTRNRHVSAWREAYEVAKKYGVAKALEYAETGQGTWRNFLDEDDVPTVDGMHLSDIPSGLSRAPVDITWVAMGEPTEQSVYVYAGLVSLHQHADGALEVRPGWAVIERSRERAEKEARFSKDL